jgi:hypothetical protein
MAISLKHAFTSAKSDGGDTSLVRPSNWNAEHNLTCATGKLLGRATAGTGAVEELDIALLDDPIIIACSDETTALTAGTNKAVFRLPFNYTITAVKASLTTAQTSGSIFTVDVNVAGGTILSTKITIDNTEKTSATAATAAVISGGSFGGGADDEVTIDIDQIGDGTAKGLKVTLIGRRA